MTPKGSFCFISYSSMKNYKKPENKHWTGRSTNNPQYWYQQIQLLDFESGSPDDVDIGLIGYQCEEGVRRNQGRVGAKAGPDAIRQQLGKLPLHHQKRIADLGNAFCEKEEMEQCQEVFSEIAASLVKNGKLSVGLGGGHDIAYAHFTGISKAFSTAEKKRIGIINFDAHFDLRPVSDSSNSGTPFNQIVKAYKNTHLDVIYLPIGIQQQSNTRELFEIAEREGVDFIADDDCTMDNISYVQRQIERLIEKVDAVYLTIDLDGFASVYAPGVSATSPFGLTPGFVRKALLPIKDSRKLIAFDIAELNPTYDQDAITAKLAARLIDILVAE